MASSVSLTKTNSPEAVQSRFREDCDLLIACVNNKHLIREITPQKMETLYQEICKTHATMRQTLHHLGLNPQAIERACASADAQVNQVRQFYTSPSEPVVRRVDQVGERALPQPRPPEPRAPAFTRPYPVAVPPAQPPRLPAQPSAQYRALHTEWEQDCELLMACVGKTDPSQIKRLYQHVCQTFGRLVDQMNTDIRAQERRGERFSHEAWSTLYREVEKKFIETDHCVMRQGGDALRRALGSQGEKALYAARQSMPQFTGVNARPQPSPTTLDVRRPPNTPTPSRMIPLLDDPLQISMQFLGKEDWHNLRLTNKHFRCLTTQALNRVATHGTHPNPELVEPCVAQNLARGIPFSSIHTFTFAGINDTSDTSVFQIDTEPHTLKKLINGRYLLLVSHPAKRNAMENFLYIRDLQTDQEIRFHLTLPIESLEVIDGREPILIFAHHTQGVKRASLKELFDLAKGGVDILDISKLTYLAGHTSPTGMALSLGPNNNMWITRLSEESSPLVATTRDERVAIAYENMVTIRDPAYVKDPLTFWFIQAEHISLYEDSLLCVSRNEWALFSFDFDRRRGTHKLAGGDRESMGRSLREKVRFTNLPLGEECVRSDNTLFTFGKRLGNEIFISWLEPFDGNVGFIYNLDTRQSRALRTDFERGDGNSLNQIISHNGSLFGASPGCFNEWRNQNYSSPATSVPNDVRTPVCNFQPVENFALSTTARIMRLHPLNGHQFENWTRVDSFSELQTYDSRNDRETGKYLVSVEIQGRYLISELVRTGDAQSQEPLIVREVKVFDLLQSPAARIAHDEGKEE